MISILIYKILLGLKCLFNFKGKEIQNKGKYYKKNVLQWYLILHNTN